MRPEFYPPEVSTRAPRGCARPPAYVSLCSVIGVDCPRRLPSSPSTYRPGGSGGPPTSISHTRSGPMNWQPFPHPEPAAEVVLEPPPCLPEH